MLCLYEEFYLTCAVKLPIFSAAFLCICHVACVKQGICVGMVEYSFFTAAKHNTTQVLIYDRTQKKPAGVFLLAVEVNYFCVFVGLGL